MARWAWARLAAPLLGAVVVACGPASQPGPASSTASSSAAAPSSGTATPADPQAQVLAAYTGMWSAYAVAARTADYQPGALSHYAAGGALTLLIHSLYENHLHGVVIRGHLVLDARVTGMSPAGSPDTSDLIDCADDTHWLDYTTSGQPAQGSPAGRHRIYAHLQLFGSTWKVTNLVVEKAGTC